MDDATRRINANAKPGKGDDAAARFALDVADLSDKAGIPIATARRRVAARNPAGFKAWKDAQRRITNRGNRTMKTDFEKHVAELEAQGLSGTEAMEKARKDHPIAFWKYQEQGREAGAEAIAKRRAEEAREKPEALRKFHRLVNETASDLGIPRTEAMTLVRKKHPDAFQAYQDA